MASDRVPHPSAEVLSNLGSDLLRQHRLDEALARYDAALELKPGLAELHFNRGLVLLGLHRLAEARDSFAGALAIRPAYPEAQQHLRHCQLLLAEAHWNENLCRALICDPEPAWDRDRWRRSKKAFAARVQRLTVPLWLGEEDVAGKTVLLYAGDGLGNTIQYCRYADQVVARGADVVLRVQPRLTALLSTLRGVRRVLGTDEPPPDADFRCPLFSLPLVFETRLPTIPARVPYLAASAEAVERWRARLGPRTRPRVGIAWSGNRAHLNDHMRSMPLRALWPLLSPSLDVVSLQKELLDEERAVIEQSRIRHFGDEQQSFADAAALVSLMDLVISVDTAVAHLAGALGLPVWILLSTPHDWRWLHDRDDSPWYPTARLFRQPRPEDWDSVVVRVATELAARFGDGAA